MDTRKSRLVRRTSWPARMIAMVQARWKAGLALALMVLMLAFVLQNAQTIQVKFLFWRVELSQALVLLLTLVSGVAIGVAVCSWRWKKRGR